LLIGANVTNFTALIDAISPIGEADVPEDWQQGRTTYGGLSAALCVAGALRAIPDLPPLRSAQFTFIGPAAGKLQITPTILRQGKNTIFVGVDLLGQAGLATRAILTFAAARQSSLRYPASPAPEVPRPADCPAFFAGARGPRFAAQFEILRAGGEKPLSAAAVPDLLVWLRHRDKAARAGLLGTIALADALPPAAFSMFSAAGQISTVTWSIDILEMPTETADGWHLMNSRGDHIADGYATQDMTLWNADGVKLLAARQTVAIFV
jgi:acyl-CoA thioesterase